MNTLNYLTGTVDKVGNVVQKDTLFMTQSLSLKNHTLFSRSFPYSGSQYMAQPQASYTLLMKLYYM